ncbi:MAG: iron ABC transporter permease, partial [Parvularculaceae bacterium]
IVLMSLLTPADSAVKHVWATTGPRYLINTVALAAMVAFGAGAIGSSAAAIVSIAEFPGRRALSLGLALPLAVPAYIAAYAYGDMFGPFGAASALFRGAPPDIKSLPGAAFILTLATYPYVYLAARASFDARSGALLEAARTLGASPQRFFVSVLAPTGRAAIAGGVALALMETVADYGVADYLGVPTLSVGIFRTWRGLGDLNAAVQLAGGLLLVALLLVMIEEGSRRGLGAESARAHRSPARVRLGPLGSALAAAFCGIPILLGFIAPAATLLARLLDGQGIARGLVVAAGNTALIATIGAALAIAIAGALAISSRGPKAPLGRALARIATLGYALPGAVVALSIVAAAGFFKVGLAAGYATLLYAYAVRFSTAGFNAVDGALKQIHPLTEEAARMLGAGLPRIIRRLFLPAARPAVIAGGLVVFIDICRELPATLLLRPFNFETLATEVYRLASDERLSEAAPAALLLIALSIVPVFLVNALGNLRR